MNEQAGTLPRGRQETTIGRLTRAVRRDRVAGVVILAAIIALVAAVIGFGGVRALRPALSRVGAWLANDDQGSVTHAGDTGRADARVPVGTAGHQLIVIQSGDGVVLVQDPATGVVSRIDPAQLEVTQSVHLDGARLQIVTGVGVAYAIDPDAGAVQRIDPQQLSLVGAPLSFNSRLGLAGIDRTGTLWVPVLQAGTVVPVRGDTAGTPVPAGRANDPLTITIAAGTAVATDPAQGTVTMLASAGQPPLQLPAAATPSPAGSPGGLLAPATTDGPLVPLLAPDTGTMVLVDTAQQDSTAVDLGAGTDHLGTPQTLGTRVYVPDRSTGELIVYDTAAHRLLTRVEVTGRSGDLDVFVKDGVLWANDPHGTAAVCVDSAGTAHHIGKDAPGLPGGTSGVPTTRAPTGGGGSDTGGDGTGGGAGPTDAPALPPGVVTQRAGAGTIVVTFTPASGATPATYTLAAVPPDAAVQPPSVPGRGPTYQFVVSGLTCGTSYQFAVVANYTKEHRSTTAGAPSLSCVSPAAPTGLSLDAGTQRQLTAAWTAPAGTGGGPLTYTVSWGAGKSATTTATRFTITGLTNFDTYTVSVTASNAAGAGPAVSATRKLSAGPWSGTIYNNAVFTVNLRTGPGTNYPSKPPGFAAPGGQHVVVVCVKTGGSWVDPSGSPSGNTWYQISSPDTGWVATGYVNTSAAVWSC